MIAPFVLTMILLAKLYPTSPNKYRQISSPKGIDAGTISFKETL